MEDPILLLVAGVTGVADESTPVEVTIYNSTLYSQTD